MPDPAPTAAPQVGDPVRYRGVSVTPLFPRSDPRAVYVTLDAVVGGGLRVTEVDDAGRVPELRVANPTRHDVLLYDGEELLGAKQNRILDHSVLVPAGATVVVPVSCVEQGRWSHVSSYLRPAPHASHPELRSRKAHRLSRAAPGTRGAAQTEVWSAVAAKAARLGAASASMANADTFAGRRGEIDALAARFPAVPGQCGAVLALGGWPVCLDALSRPDAFAAL